MPVASIGGGDLSKVWEIKTLGLAKDAEARKLLEDVAAQVQPIMRKRKWKVPLLSEFCPSNPSLLGLNIDGGREIRIRLRRQRNDSQLFGYEETLGTMLHELCHIQCGPHDSAFYKLLDELTKECEELMLKGIKGTGQGFDAQGQRLGGVTHNPSPSDLRKVALAAAEKRARTGFLMPGGPQRLGGDSEIMKALSPIQAAAMAAERRSRDDLWCAAPVTSSKDGMNKAREREESSPSQPDHVRDSSNAAAGKENQVLKENSWHVDGTDVLKKGAKEVERSKMHAAAKRRAGASMEYNDPWKEGQRRTGDSTSSGEGTRSNPVRIVDSYENMSQEEMRSSWECHICTLLNPALALSCGVCATPRRQMVSNKVGGWTCKFCTLQNKELSTNCAACDQWRYSYGAPSSSRAPNVGT